MEVDRYDVVLVGLDDGAPADPATAFAEAFGIDRAAAADVLARAPIVVKHDVAEDVAQRYLDALHTIGVRVHLERRVPGASDRPRVGPSLAPPKRMLAPVTPPKRALPPVTPPSAPAAAQVPLGAPATAPSGEPSKAPQGTVYGSYPLALLSAFIYPVRSGPGVVILVAVALLVYVGSIVPLVGGLIAIGVEAAYGFSVLRASSTGDRVVPGSAYLVGVDASPPGASRITSFVGDLLSPFVRYLVATAIIVAPAVLVYVRVPHTESWFEQAVAAAVALGLVYMPAAYIVAAEGRGCLSLVSPIAGIQMMFRVPGPYLLTALATSIVTVVGVVVSVVLRPVLATIPLPLLPGLLAECVHLYFIVVVFHMLGVFLHQYENELGF